MLAGDWRARGVMIDPNHVCRLKSSAPLTPMRTPIPGGKMAAGALAADGGIHQLHPLRLRRFDAIVVERTEIPIGGFHQFSDFA